MDREQNRERPKCNKVHPEGQGPGRSGWLTRLEQPVFNGGRNSPEGPDNAEPKEARHQPEVEIFAKPEARVNKERGDSDHADGQVGHTPDCKVADGQPFDALAQRKQRGRNDQPKQRNAAYLLCLLQ